MKVMFKPLHKIDEVIHINSIACERMYAGISKWRYGEVKNIPDDVKFREDGHYVSLVEDLLSDYSFRPANGKNLNFHCNRCGIETLQEVKENPINNLKGIPLETKDGRRLCLSCFNKIQKG